MKKLLLLIALAFNCALSMAQDTTAVTMTDSARMYTYKNVYAMITSVQVLPPGRKTGPFTGVDSVKWTTAISLSVYSSKADFKAGKPELFSTYLQTLFTDKFPTQKEILDRMRSVIK